MSIDITQHVHLKIELDGTARVAIFSGTFSQVVLEAMRFLRDPDTRWQKRSGAKEIIWTFRDEPFLAASKTSESLLSLVTDVHSGLDLSGIPVVED